MTYFDPEIYDPKKLVDEDAIEMRGFEWCTECAECFFDNIEPKCSAKPLDDIYQAVASDIKDQLLDWLASSRIELTVSLMDNNDKYYEE